MIFFRNYEIYDFDSPDIKNHKKSLSQTLFLLFRPKEIINNNSKSLQLIKKLLNLSETG
jgi:hypothetical protein